MNTFFVWFTSYFTSLEIGVDTSSLFLSIYGLAVLIGMLLRKKLIQYFKRKRILLFSFTISIFLLIGVLFIGNLVIKNILIFLFGMSMAGNFSITFSISSEFFPRHTNSASGIIVAFSNLGVMVFQYTSGYFSEYYSRNSVLYIDISILLILISTTAVFCKLKFLTFAKLFPQAPVGNFFVN